MSDRKQARDRQKAEYHAYRQAAVVPGHAITVPTYATVQTCEDGAYVEALIFVPDSAMRAHLVAVEIATEPKVPDAGACQKCGVPSGFGHTFQCPEALYVDDLVPLGGVGAAGGRPNPRDRA